MRLKGTIRYFIFFCCFSEKSRKKKFIFFCCFSRNSRKKKKFCPFPKTAKKNFSCFPKKAEFFFSVVFQKTAGKECLNFFLSFPPPPPPSPKKQKQKIINFFLPFTPAPSLKIVENKLFSTVQKKMMFSKEQQKKVIF